MKSLEKINFIIELVKKGVDVDLSFHLQELEQFKQDLEFLKVLIEHLAIVEKQFDVDEVVNILVLNDIDEITNFRIYKRALEYINKYGVKNVGS